MNTKDKTIIIATSGTGGHIYPGLELAKEFRKKGYIPIFFISNNMISIEIFKNNTFKYVTFNLFCSPHKLTKSIIPFIFRMLCAFFKSLVIISKLKPLAIIGMGGYISVPSILAAKILRKKTFIHEQNVIPGKANILLSKITDKVFISFNKSRKYLGKNTILFGCPIRHNIVLLTTRRQFLLRQIGFNDKKPIIFIFGGSIGSKIINTVACETFLDLAKQNKFQIIHVTGFNNCYDIIKSKVIDNHFYKVFKYIHNIGAAYSVSDVVICRSGASTIFELQTLKKPAVLIPYLYASNNHQYWNAYGSNNFHKIILNETTLTKQSLLDAVSITLHKIKKNRYTFFNITKLPQELICNEILKSIK